MNDTQDNAYLALHIIHNLNKYFKNLYITFVSSLTNFSYNLFV